MKKREFSPEYKLKIVLEILKENNTISEIAAREQVHANVLGVWKREFLDNGTKVFGRSKDEKAAKEEIAKLKKIEKQYQAKVGQLALENDFLKGVYKKIYGKEWQQ